MTQDSSNASNAGAAIPRSADVQPGFPDVVPASIQPLSYESRTNERPSSGRLGLQVIAILHLTVGIPGFLLAVLLTLSALDAQFAWLGLCAFPLLMVYFATCALAGAFSLTRSARCWHVAVRLFTCDAVGAAVGMLSAFWLASA